MRAKGFLPLILVLIITASAGCDNVEWDGTEIRIEPPPPSPATLEAERAEAEAEEEEMLEPVSLSPLVYLVQRTDPGEPPETGDGATSARDATLLPVAQLTGNGYSPLPDPAETPDLVERFPLERWEPETEFVVFSQGAPVGRFIADGSSRLDETFCLARARGSGILHVRPGAASEERFLALRRDDLPDVPSALTPHPGFEVTDEFRNRSLDAARTLIPRLGVPWPPSVLGIRRRIDAFTAGESRRAVAASFVFGDDLQVGSPQPTGYSLFLIAAEEDDEFSPVFSWYQSADAGPKAFPGFLAAADLRQMGEPDILLEVFGQEARWLAFLGWEGEARQLVYQDPCGVDPVAGALQDHP